MSPPWQCSSSAAHTPAQFERDVTLHTIPPQSEAQTDKQPEREDTVTDHHNVATNN